MQKKTNNHLRSANRKHDQNAQLFGRSEIELLRSKIKLGPLVTNGLFSLLRSILRASDIALETADEGLLARSSAIDENKNDLPAVFPAKPLIEYEPTVTSFFGLHFQWHICDLQIAIKGCDL